MPDQNWQFELEEYIKQGEPDRAEKSEAWQTAIGLQAVDGLNTSAYLLDTAKDHIEGKITIDEAQQRIHSYYEQRTTRTEIENETKEADIVSARIAKLLGEKTFQFSPAEWITIHRRLFEGVFDHAGQIRKYNISKKEWILNGETVIYADFNSIKDTLDYDFATEKQFSYEGLSVEASVKHLAKFASDIWQIHSVLPSLVISLLSPLISLQNRQKCRFEPTLKKCSCNKASRAKKPYFKRLSAQTKRPETGTKRPEVDTLTKRLEIS